MKKQRYCSRFICLLCLRKVFLVLSAVAESNTLRVGSLGLPVAFESIEHIALVDVGRGVIRVQENGLIIGRECLPVAFKLIERPALIYSLLFGLWRWDGCAFCCLNLRFAILLWSSIAWGTESNRIPLLP